MPAFLTNRLGASARAWRLLGAAAFLSLALAGCDSESQEPSEGAQQPPPAVSVTTVELQTVDVFSDYAGRVRASREVEVRARVDGILEKRLHLEGSTVRQGEALFRIDPAPFEVAVQAAEAELATAQADMQHAELDWQRFARLFERNAVSERERDEARTRVEVARAAVAAAEAHLRQAQLELGYTQVEAPIAGVTSLEAVPEGSLVSRGALLTEIVQHDPVHVRFALPESDAAIQRTALSAIGRSNGGEYRREGRLLLPDGSEYREPGEIDFTASTVDPRTGTVTARAVFPNADRDVVPGQFVRIRVLLQTLKDVHVVPEEAVGQGPQGPQVFVVDEENIAHSRPVELGPLVGSGRVVLAGLEANDRVVVNGQVALRDGVPVSPEEVAVGPSADAGSEPEAGEAG